MCGTGWETTIAADPSSPSHVSFEARIFLCRAVPVLGDAERGGNDEDRVILLLHPGSVGTSMSSTHVLVERGSMIGFVLLRGPSLEARVEGFGTQN